jgi:hypothetical protein
MGKMMDEKQYDGWVMFSTVPLTAGSVPTS